MIYVTSDWHFNHTNILRYCRPQFKDINEHNEHIIAQHNAIVQKDDLVYMLGDVGFTPATDLAPLVRRINGRKILLIGNHDRLNDSVYKGMGFIEVYRHPIYFSTNVILSHVPVQEALHNPWVVNVHGHLHNGALTEKNFINVNVELNDFKPLDLKEIEERARKMCRQSRYEPYPHEWYAAFEKKNN